MSVSISTVNYIDAGQGPGNKCPYCKTEGSNFAYGLWASALTPEDLEILLNRGWARLGMYIFKPTKRTKCCPHYTIRCSALEFKISKSQKKVLRKFNKFLGKPLGQRSSELELEDYLQPETSDRRSKATSPNFEIRYLNIKSEEFEATFADEFALFKKYQMAIHGEKEEDCTELGFRLCFCQTPLTNSNSYCGSFHHLYYIDKKLVAVGVLDILPTSMCSIYFFYDPDPSYRALSLGTVGALMEISLVRKMARNGLGLTYYSMGAYVPSSKKVLYKANFYPTLIQCPNSNYSTWVPLDEKMRKSLESGLGGTFPASASTLTPIRTKKLKKQLLLQEKVDVNNLAILHGSSILNYSEYMAIRKSEGNCRILFLRHFCFNPIKKEKKAIQEYCNQVGDILTERMWLYVALND